MDWFIYEKTAALKGKKIVCGIDEAGRGPLAGPVCAAAVILPRNCEIDGLDDSKKLSEKKRDILYEVVKDTAKFYGIGFASEEEIDRLNILNATYLAMKRAYEQLPIEPDWTIVDGNRMPGWLKNGETLVKGDSKSASVAAASILAKVSRDRIMADLHNKYPEYGFCTNKGYGTKLHYEAIKEYGILKEHRKSFLKNLADK